MAQKKEKPRLVALQRWRRGSLVVPINIGDRPIATKSQEIAIKLAVTSVDLAILKMTGKIK